MSRQNGTEQMDIGVLTDVLFSGGAQKICLDLAQGLARTGHHVTVYYEYDNKAQVRVKESVELVPFPFSRTWFQVRFKAPRRLRYLLAPVTGKAWDYWLAAHRMGTMPLDLWSIHNIHGRRMPITFPFHLSRHRPVLWTFHDMWPITGGCDFAEGTGFMEACSACSCQQVPTHGKRLAPNQELRLRNHLWHSDHNIVIITPSSWLRREVERSAVASHVRVEVIHNGVDTDLFRPRNRQEARRQIGVPLEQKYVLVLANQLKSRRKGAEYALAIVTALQNHQESVIPIFVGNGAEEVAATVGGRSYWFPYTTDPAELARYYAATDVFLFTSLAENLPLTIMEAMACGTPVVAFDVGGVAEEIVNGQMGTIRPAGDVAGCVRDILAICQDDIAAEWGTAARKHVERYFTLDRMATGYERLMHELVEMPVKQWI